MGQRVGFRHSAATKRKLSAMRRGQLNPFYGRKHSATFIANLRKRMRDNTLRRFCLDPCTLKTMDGLVSAYVAAIVDGEGSIGFHRTAPQVCVYNTSFALMKWLVRNVGGSYFKRATKRKRIYIWNVASARNVHALLGRIRPYLVIKGHLADGVVGRLKSKYGDQLDEDTNG